MTDLVSTGVPTSDATGVTGVQLQSQQQLPSASSPYTPSPVNPAQIPPSFQQPQQQQQSITIDTATVANYESRIRNLMSEKDRAINEKNQAIAQLAQLQVQYTQEKEQLQQSLNTTTTAAQTTIQQARQYENDIASLKGQLLRANTLLERPHLAVYAQFLPVTDNADQMKAAVDQFEAARQQDYTRSGFPGASTMTATPQMQQLVPGMAPSPSTPAPFYQQPQAQLPQSVPPSGLSNLPSQSQAVNPLALYANRPNMHPMAMAGSTPAAMNPMGGTTHTQIIEKTMRDALASGDTARFEAALAEAKAMLPAAIQSELGR